LRVQRWHLVPLPLWVTPFVWNEQKS